MEVISIVYATDKNYVLMAAVSLRSLIQNADPSRNYQVYLLIDSSVSEEDKELFYQLEHDWANLKIAFYLIREEALEKLDTSFTYLNKSTYYRLCLPELLKDVPVCIYLDADTLILDDITELANIRLKEEYIAGVLDPGIDTYGYRLKELPDMNSYVNAGVLILNLQLIREKGLQRVFLEKISGKYRFNDQDILNICCYGHIKALPERFNFFAYKDPFHVRVVVSHFLSLEGLRPWYFLKARGAETWWDYAEYFKDTEIYRSFRKAAEERYHAGCLKFFLIKCKESEQVYIWGSTGVSAWVFRGLVLNGVKNICGFVDNKTEKQGLKLEGTEILPSDAVSVDGRSLIIITAQKQESRDAIKKQLSEMGFDEKQVIIYQKHAAGFYTYLDPRYLAEEKEEVFLWEYGRPTRA